MNNWIPKNKTVYLAAVSALLSVILYFGGLYIVGEGIKKVENFYSGTESASAKEQKFRAVKTVADENKDAIEILRSSFVKKGDEVKFIESIEETAASSNIKFDISSLDAKNDASSFKEDIKITAKTEGSWKNTITFLDKIEKMPFTVSIDDVDLNSYSDGNWSSTIKLTVFREK